MADGVAPGRRVASAAAARTASEAVAEQIRGEIATGRLKPGDRLLSETALLERYAVARPTMREALRMLESDGLVTIERGNQGGARVREPNVGRLARQVGLHLQLRGTKLHELVDAQIAFQPRAAALAAASRTSADLIQLRARVERLAASGGPGEYVLAVAAFVDSLVRASHNSALILFVELTGELLRDEMVASVGRGQIAQRVIEGVIGSSAEHYVRLVDLIEARDGDGAEEFWRAYLQTTDAGGNGAGRSRLQVYPPPGQKR